MRIHDSPSNPSALRPRRQPEPPPPEAPLREHVIHAIKQVYDPEIPVNIYDLGLIYDIHLDEPTKKAAIRMTLTTPNCPEAQSIPQYVQQMVERVDGIDEASVEIVWDPPWTKDRMSEEARLVLGMT
jgi:FeS assembly SUF system protein